MSVLKADATAADRLLKAAVRKATRQIREASEFDHWHTTWGRGIGDVRRDAVVTMLAEATRAADLLLEPREVSA